MKEARYIEIGATIKKLHTDRYIKQESFAEALGTSVQTVSRWENDANYPDIVMHLLDKYNLHPRIICTNF